MKRVSHCHLDPQDTREEKISSRITRKIMTEGTRFCKNCKRDVSTANFSLHEAHCLRFLTLCSECDEPVARKDMKDHQTEAHKQVRCNLCCRSMQQYQLEHHKTKECHKRAMKCKICELEMPFNKLQEHLNTCASRTERCWECNKYVMYKDQKKHKDICQNSGLSYYKDVNFQTRNAYTNAKFIDPTGASDNICLRCNKSFPDNQYSQHLKNNCSATHNLTEVLAGQSTSKPVSDSPLSSSSLAPSSCPVSATTWKDISPKGKKREHPLTSKTLLKPPKNKRMVGIHFPTESELSTSSQVLKDTQSYDMLVTCAHCNTPLPLSALQKHEIKCLHFISLKNVKMNQKPRSGKKEDSF
ncbi:XIAP-associated factor 1 isoform X3 [Gallus gallus]|uniref:XIAP-associated factor 1 isoform X3 n=2 Tax=Gallus gallus TaxID=9031 RepID=UPI000739C649|nr:XIAP-associated factor 1 isoform X3 [Gallus gallus]|eukprot:XP_004946868.2 XIAP-associated factor 1 isoform X4 [Gallus gallus]